MHTKQTQYFINDVKLKFDKIVEDFAEIDVDVLKTMRTLEMPNNLNILRPLGFKNKISVRGIYSKVLNNQGVDTEINPG